MCVYVVLLLLLLLLFIRVLLLFVCLCFIHVLFGHVYNLRLPSSVVNIFIGILKHLSFE